jgi:hypothetical protein
MWLSLWREDGSVVYNCSGSSPAQSFPGPSPLGLVTIFYCLRFETFLFVASYDSQGCSGGIRPRLHTGGFLLTNTLSTILVPLINSRQQWRRKQFFHCCSPAVVLLIIYCLVMGTCLLSRCPDMALVYRPISRYFYSNGSTRYST